MNKKGKSNNIGYTQLEGPNRELTEMSTKIIFLLKTCSEFPFAEKNIY